MAGQGVPPVQPDDSSPKKRRTAALRVRITSDERRALDNAAERAGVGPCSFARVAVMAALDLQPTPPPPRRRKPSEAAVSVARFLGEIGKVGNNINQLARCVNSGVGIDPNAIEEIQNELRRLRESILANSDKNGLPS